MCCAAQSEWGPVGAKWWYGAVDVPLFGPPPYAEWPYHMEAIGESMIQDRVCSEISFLGNDYCAICDPCYIHEDSNRVYYFSPALNGFHLLYDMNGNPGESWEVVFHSNAFNPPLQTMEVMVVDTMSIVVNGIRLKQQRVTVDGFEYDHPMLFGGTITESIGGDMSFFPMIREMCEVGYTGLRCYEDNAIGTHHVTTEDCDYTITEVPEHTSSIVADVWPNPTNHFLNIEWQRLPIGEITLFDAMGRQVLRQQSHEQRERIDVSGFPNGLYVIQLVQGEVKSSLRIVVQH